MYKFLIFIGLAFISDSILAQRIHESIPDAFNLEISAKALENWYKIPALNKWLQARNDDGDSNTVNRTTADHVLFRWPMRANDNYDDIPNYYTVTNYMDVNRATSNPTRDWFCSTLNYQDHEGNDYSLYPFFWRMKEKQNVLATSGSAGIVIAVRDSTDNDNNCNQPGENKSANYVAILNADSSISRYLHIKKNSAKVTLGQFVQEGQTIASIGSSGSSSNPHLHFDLQYFRTDNNEYDFVEPFFSTKGNCNTATNDSWWKNQKTYIDPQLNRIMTHYGTPVLQGDINSTEILDFCPEMEDAKAKAQFSAGDPLVVGVALSHVNRYDSLNVRIIQPNGTQWIRTARSVPNTVDGYGIYFRRKIYMTFTYVLPANAPTGTYTIITDFTYRPFDEEQPFDPRPGAEITKTFQEYFTVGCITSQTLSGTSSLEEGYIVSNSINSTQTLSGKTRYQSGNYVQLNPGFVAQAGATFKARIRDCNASD